jgi:hypothetical protein
VRAAFGAVNSKNGQYPNDIEASGGCAGSGDDENRANACAEADPVRARSGFLFHYAAEGLPELRLRYPAVGSRPSKCCMHILFDTSDHSKQWRVRV